MSERDGGRLLFEAGLDNSNLRSGAAQATNILHGVGDKAVAEGARIDSAFRRIATGIGSVFVLQQASQLVSALARVRGEFQQLEVAFETMLQSKQKADALMGQLVRTAAITPFGLKDVAGGAKQLLAYGESAESVNDTLVRLGDIAAGLSIPLNDLVYLYGTTMVQGRLFAQDVRQFQGRGIPLLQELGKALGKSTDDINEMVSAGKIGFPEVQKVIQNLTSEGGAFYNLMAKQSKTITGQISNLGDAFDTMLNKIGQSSEGVISGAISGATLLVDNYAEIGKEILGLVAAYGAYKAAIISLNAIRLLNIKILRQAVLEKKLALYWGRELTKAQAVAAARTKMLAVAQQGLVKALKAVKAAMLSNPYVLAAAAVAGLAYGIYKLATAETSAEAAQRKHGEAMEAETERAENFKTKIDALVGVIKDETRSIYEQVEAYKKLKEEMPEKFGSKTLSEVKSMSPQEVSSAINREITDERIAAVNGAVEDARRKVAALQSELDSMRAQASRSPMSAGSSVPMMLTSRMLKEAKEILQLKEDEKKKQDEVIRLSAFELKTNAEKASIRESELKALEAQRAEVEATLTAAENATGAWKGFGIETMKNKALLSQLSEEIRRKTDEVNSYKDAATGVDKKSLAKSIAEAQSELSKLNRKGSWTLEEQKRIEELRESLKSLKEKYKNLSGDDFDKQATEAKQQRIAAAERIEKIKEYEEAVEKSVRDAELEIEQARIDAMEDGFEKQSAQVELGYKKLIAQNRQRREGMVKELNAKDEVVWQQENPSFKEKGLLYTDRKTDKDLSDAQLKQLEAFTDLANDYKKNANRETLKNMLAEFASYEQQVTNTTKEYENKRRQMHNDDGSLKEGFTSANVDELERSRENDLNAINLLFAEREATFRAWMDSVANMSLKQLEEALKQAENELAKFEASGEKDSAKLAVAKAKVAKAKKSVEEESAKDSTSPGKRSIKEWQDLQKTLQGVNGQLGDIGDTVGGIAGEVIKTASNIAGGTIAMIDGIKVLAVSAGESISAVEKASVILAIVGAAIQIITAIFNMSSKAEATHQAALEDVQKSKLAMQREYNLLLLEQNLLLKEAETIFGDNGYRRATNAVEVYKEALEGLRAAIGGTKSRRGSSSVRGNPLLTDGLRDVTIKTGHEKTGIFGWGAGRDIYSSVLGVYPELIDKTGKFDAELAKVIISTQTMSDESKASLQNMVDLAEAAEKAYEEVNEYLSGIFGELGNSISDSLTDAFRNGTDAAQAFSDSVSSMLEALAEDMIYSVTLAPIFEQAQAKMLGAMHNGDLTDQEKFEKYTQIMTGLVSDANAAKGAAFDMYKMFQDEAAEQGLELWKSDSRAATQKGFESMNQDTGAELSGKFTAMQALMQSVADSGKLLVANSATALRHLAGIESNTARLERIELDMGAVKAGIDSINTKGITIKQAA